MRKKFVSFLLLFVLYSAYAMAQTQTITGKVLDENGNPVEGASIVIKGTSQGTAALADGSFKLEANRGDVLVISAVNFNSTEITVKDQTSISVTLYSTQTEIGEVIVTALGIQRSRNQVAYSAQQIGGEEVSKLRTNNAINSLAGKISGLEIRQNNSLGASTNVVLRGFKSLSGDNQALFVIDGVPYNNANTNGSLQAQGAGGYDYGNAAADINPDNIASITVLKGAAASALYGSRGANGVIMITTKKPKKGLGVVVNSGLSLSFIDKTTFPKYQKEYGGGYGAYYEDPETRRFLYRDINGDGTEDDLVVPMSEDASYGGKFDPNLMVYQWDAFDPYSPNYGKPRPWVAAENDPSTFFEKPVSNNQSIFISGGGDKTIFKMGYTRTDDKGVLPNSDLIKNLLDFSAAYNVTEKLSVGGSISYANINGLGRYGTGYDGAKGRNVMTSFREWFQTNVDIKEQREAYFRSGGQNITWNWADPTDLVPIYWDNPYFVRYKNYESDTRDRYFGNVNVNYQITDWLHVMGRVSVDNYSELQEDRKDVGTVGLSSYSRYNHSWNETNYDLMLNFDKNVSKDFNIKALLGGNIRRQHDQSISASTNGGLITPGLFALSNSLNTPNAPVESDAVRQVNGIFAGATITWRNMLTLDGTVRRDEASTLPEDEKSYYYPAGSFGFVFSELLKTSAPWLSYGKLRANYAEVGNDAPIYSTIDVFSFNVPFGSNPQTVISTTKNNSNLKPERTKSYEIGLEAAFLKNRIGFDVTYYHNKTVDEIVPVPLSTATGFSFQFLNSAEVLNKGWEVSLYATPVQIKNFSWNFVINWSRNRNEVLSLYKDAYGNQAQNLLLGSYQGGITVNAALNEPYGVIRGTDFIYTNGQRTVGSNGQYLKTATSNQAIGNINPDWIGSMNNTFRYKNLALSFLIDVKDGGDVFSVDMYYGLATGLYPETAGLNDLGNPSRNSLSEGGGFIREGVTADGKPNTVRVSNYNYGQYGYSINPDKAFVYDAGFVKLREAVLTYSLPSSVLQGWKFIKGIDLSLVGRNLWIIHKNLPYADPEEGLSAGNLQGVQIGAYPATRSVAFNAKFTF